jgi:YNFM family putative membrane transporter
MTASGRGAGSRTAVVALWALIIASAVFVTGIAMIVPAMIALIGGRAGSTRAGALGLCGLALFAGASCGPLAAELPLGFAGLLLTLAALLIIGAALVAASARRPAEVGTVRPR